MAKEAVDALGQHEHQIGEDKADEDDGDKGGLRGKTLKRAGEQDGRRNRAGPAISGIASGKAAMLWIMSLVMATSPIFSLRSCRRSNTISKAMKNSRKPPATRKAGSVMPNTDRIDAPATANTAITRKAMVEARTETWLRSSRFMPRVTAEEERGKARRVDGHENGDEGIEQAVEARHLSPSPPAYARTSAFVEQSRFGGNRICAGSNVGRRSGGGDAGEKLDFEPPGRCGRRVPSPQARRSTTDHVALVGLSGTEFKE